MELRLQPLLQRATSIPSSDVSPRGALCNRLKINLFNVVSGVSPHWQLDLSPEPPPQPKIMDGWIIGWMTLSWVLRTCRCSTYLQAGNTAVPQQNSWRQCCAVKIGNDLRLTNKWKMLSKRQQAHQWCDLKKFQGKKKNSGSYLVVPVTPIPPEKPFGHVLFPIPWGTQGGEWKTKMCRISNVLQYVFFFPACKSYVTESLQQWGNTSAETRRSCSQIPAEIALLHHQNLSLLSGDAEQQLGERSSHLNSPSAGGRAITSYVCTAGVKYLGVLAQRTDAGLRGIWRSQWLRYRNTVVRW